MASLTHHKKNTLIPSSHRALQSPFHGSITQKMMTWTIDESKSKAKATVAMEMLQKHQSFSYKGQRKVVAYKSEVVTKEASARKQTLRHVSEKGQFVAIRKEVVTKEVKEVKYVVNEVSYKQNKGKSTIMDKNKKQICYRN
ncbi:hypothetical protein JCGZ_05001 [Jatropha curcas]|uniref:Uncharacterized protein n=1 Tax=Jatropha curcas TaxID=180498 RepID=A0A067L425_JATCU|nr:hypothetical protein JCGZ_05001 [Jatropha curcas]